jgi:hypothetical protein
MHRVALGRWRVLVVAVMGLGGGPVHHPMPGAQVFFNEETVFDLTRLPLPEELTWSTSFARIGRGLSTGPGRPNAFTEVFVQFPPVPAGLEWRPSGHVSLTVTLQGVSASPDASVRAYFRYSADRVHWSTWYALSGGDPASWTYDGHATLPRKARERYSELMGEWWKTDPVWSSDEHELCAWIARNRPEFFDTEIPFIGWAQVLLEGLANQFEFSGMTVRASSASSGLHSIPRDGGDASARRLSTRPWRFNLEEHRRRQAP